MHLTSSSCIISCFYLLVVLAKVVVWVVTENMVYHLWKTFLLFQPIQTESSREVFWRVAKSCIFFPPWTKWKVTNQGCFCAWLNREWSRCFQPIDSFLYITRQMKVLCLLARRENCTFVPLGNVGYFLITRELYLCHGQEVSVVSMVPCPLKDLSRSNTVFCFRRWCRYALSIKCEIFFFYFKGKKKFRSLAEIYSYNLVNLRCISLCDA